MSYVHNATIHNTHAAEKVVPHVINLFHPQSVIDVGCGIGTWLAVFDRYGIKDYVGIDGNYVNLSQLHIEKSRFIPVDLSLPFEYHRKFDLVLCLEVAEHLPASAADTFVNTLVSLGDVILFSAAIPQQGGQNHINEQWASYWMKKFKNHGYYFYDIMRAKIWYDESIDWWYRQNMFIVANKNYQLTASPAIASPIDVVHPELLKIKSQTVAGLQNKVTQIEKKLLKAEKRYTDLQDGKVSVQKSLRIVINSIKYAFKRRLSN